MWKVSVALCLFVSSFTAQASAASNEDRVLYSLSRTNEIVLQVSNQSYIWFEKCKLGSVKMSESSNGISSIQIDRKTCARLGNGHIPKDAVFIDQFNSYFTAKFNERVAKWASAGRIEALQLSIVIGAVSATFGAAVGMVMGTNVENGIGFRAMRRGALAGGVVGLIAVIIPEAINEYRLRNRYIKLNPFEKMFANLHSVSPEFIEMLFHEMNELLAESIENYVSA